MAYLAQQAKLVNPLHGFDAEYMIINIQWIYSFSKERRQIVVRGSSLLKSNHYLTFSHDYNNIERRKERKRE